MKLELITAFPVIALIPCTSVRCISKSVEVIESGKTIVQKINAKRKPKNKNKKKRKNIGALTPCQKLSRLMFLRRSNLLKSLFLVYFDFLHFN